MKILNLVFTYFMGFCLLVVISEATDDDCPLNSEDLPAGTTWRKAGSICYLIGIERTKFHGAEDFCEGMSTGDCPSRLIEVQHVHKMYANAFDDPEVDLIASYHIGSYYLESMHSWVDSETEQPIEFPSTLAKNKNTPMDARNKEGSHAAFRFNNPKIIGNGKKNGKKFPLCQSCAEIEEEQDVCSGDCAICRQAELGPAYEVIWSSWSECSDAFVQTRSSRCAVPSPLEGLGLCDGFSEEVEEDSSQCCDQSLWTYSSINPFMPELFLITYLATEECGFLTEETNIYAGAGFDRVTLANDCSEGDVVTSVKIISANEVPGGSLQDYNIYFSGGDYAEETLVASGTVPDYSPGTSQGSCLHRVTDVHTFTDGKRVQSVILELVSAYGTDFRILKHFSITLATD